MDFSFKKCSKRASAGISAASGIPTFRGKGGFWRGYAVQTLAALSKFKENPSLVWECYHYRREIVLTKQPTLAHYHLAEVEKQFEQTNRKFVIITQNIDELHTKAGSKNVIELHGSLFKTQCMECGIIAENYNSPICPALLDKGSPEEGTPDAAIPTEMLPTCTVTDCNGLLRPYIIWFDEDPTPEHMEQSCMNTLQKKLPVSVVCVCIDEWLNNCDLCLIIGTSSVVEPANEFGPLVAARGVPVAEFNLETTPATPSCQYHIPGLCDTTLIKALPL
ncbi:NAD-dependent protein deacylase sirtuin-5, mitochondrial [Orchesella cincta]|uniref:NAD-dependent protein deacylase sirtuin-5, mitochondrial n=1 Tax=Orchesella cincta TaxID=48709 RepID=A0A1D2NJP8_ORCCI|nr:NAD-dependent protein deacylase sirtuin-5, mitochondrial [Orchesella cincta]